MSFAWLLVIQSVIWISIGVILVIKLHRKSVSNTAEKALKAHAEELLASKKAKK